MSTPLPQSYQDKIAALSSALQSYCIATLTNANIGFEYNGALNLWVVNDSSVTAAETIIDTQSTWMAAARAIKQQQLDDFFDGYAVFSNFVRSGTLTTVTTTNVGNFQRDVTNNYRILRASIVAAATPSAVAAISVTSGWPANP